MREKCKKGYFALSRLLLSDFLLFDILFWRLILGSQNLESSIPGPESWVLSPRSWVPGVWSWVLSPPFLLLNLESWVSCPGSCVLNPGLQVMGPEFQVLGLRFWVPCLGSWVLCPGSYVLGCRSKVLNSGSQVPGSASWVLGLRSSQVLGFGLWILTTDYVKQRMFFLLYWNFW